MTLLRRLSYVNFIYEHDDLLPTGTMKASSAVFGMSPKIGEQASLQEGCYESAA